MDTSAGTKSERIVIVRLLGGLGNQMFQYALGRQLAILHNKTLKLDTSAYLTENQTARFAAREFGLDAFKIQKNIATNSDIAPFKKYLKQTFFSRILRRLSGGNKYYLNTYIHEPHGKSFVFDRSLLLASLKPVVYLDGFWQTEKYFKNIEEVIRKDFIFNSSAEGENKKLLEEISGADSCGIHIRHGDNATKLAAKHGVLPLKYYYQALTELSKKVKISHAYVFSDDQVWAKKNLNLKVQTTFVTHNGERASEDMRLMSACKHHIIGNSTFSWWSAYLGKKPGQLVFAPSRYHMSDNIPTADLYPAAWQVIEV